MRTTAAGSVLRANRIFCEWIGFSAEELVGKRRFQDSLTMGGRIFHQTHWDPLLQMQGSISEVKLELSCRDGTTIPMVLNVHRREEGGAVVHDISAFVSRDRDRYEQELVRARKSLEALMEVARQSEAETKYRELLAEQMIGIVSHDLRNPWPWGCSNEES